MQDRKERNIMNGRNGQQVKAHYKESGHHHGSWSVCSSTKCKVGRTTIFHSAEAMRVCNDLIDGYGLLRDHGVADKDSRIRQAMKRILFLEAGGDVENDDDRLIRSMNVGSGADDIDGNGGDEG